MSNNIGDNGCEVCSTGTPKAGEDICEECYEEWATEELKMQEAELANEVAFESSLERPSIFEPLDDWEAAIKHVLA